VPMLPLEMALPRDRQSKDSQHYGELSIATRS